MAVQRQFDLNKPVASEGESKLELTKLTPDLVLASLELHGDYYAKLEGLWVKSFLWSAPVISIIVAAVSGYLYYILRDYIEISETYGEFFRLIFRSSDIKVSLTMIFPIIAISIAIFGIVGLFIGDEFRQISKKMDQTNYVEEIYGFPILKFAKLPMDKINNLKEKKLEDNGKNSQVILYKTEPIGIITLKPLFDKSNDSNLIVKITGLSIRPAFKKLNFEELLIKWAIETSKSIYAQYLKDKKITDSRGCKITLLTDNYSFNTALENILKAHQFSKVSSSFKLNPVNDNTALMMGVFNPWIHLSRDTYALHIIDQR